MSDQIKHECGVALIRLKKPLQYFIDTYGSPTWAVQKLYLLMEKQKQFHTQEKDTIAIQNGQWHKIKRT
jgi:amidophosphoribosyltransferase